MNRLQKWKLKRRIKSFKKQHEGLYVRVKDKDQFVVVNYLLGHKRHQGVYEVILEELQKRHIIIGISATNFMVDELNKRAHSSKRKKVLTFKRFIDGINGL